MNLDLFQGSKPLLWKNILCFIPRFFHAKWGHFPSGKCCTNVLWKISMVWKIFFYDWIYSRFEDWSLFFTTTPRNLLYDFFPPVYRTLNIRLRFLEFSSFEATIWSSIKRRKEILHQVFDGRHKEGVSIFKSVVASVRKKIVHCFYILWQFTILTTSVTQRVKLTRSNVTLQIQ